ncbi:hypothetical protein PROFUN_13634 [Planoprotostelium fungivorum]|uniref:ATPase AAA-type core domain-containing protein n=1 Tax=Planoprotostelium fungivorum TaxID=1890364 RepID=A0A2P6MZW5_9EUKA|nr:hypothetical protein PROFUN_13634 [Planoprotostelium fungivorum]
MPTKGTLLGFVTVSKKENSDGSAGSKKTAENIIKDRNAELKRKIERDKMEDRARNVGRIDHPFFKLQKISHNGNGTLDGTTSPVLPKIWDTIECPQFPLPVNVTQHPVERSKPILQTPNPPVGSRTADVVRPLQLSLSDSFFDWVDDCTEREAEGTLWTNRYRPHHPELLLRGQDGGKYICRWLAAWKGNRTNDVPPAILLIGSHAAAKTATIEACCEAYHCDIIEVNGSDHRTSRHLQQIEEATRSQSVLSHDRASQSEGEDKSQQTRASEERTTVILFEDVDTCSRDEKSFVQSMCDLIKRTRVPIICTADHYNVDVSKLVTECNREEVDKLREIHTNDLSQSQLSDFLSSLYIRRGYLPQPTHTSTTIECAAAKREICRLSSTLGDDARSLLNTAQFWLQHRYHPQFVVDPMSVIYGLYEGEEYDVWGKIRDGDERLEDTLSFFQLDVAFTNYLKIKSEKFEESYKGPPNQMNREVRHRVSAELRDLSAHAELLSLVDVLEPTNDPSGDCHTMTHPSPFDSWNESDSRLQRQMCTHLSLSSMRQTIVPNGSVAHRCIYTSSEDMSEKNTDGRVRKRGRRERAGTVVPPHCGLLPEVALDYHSAILWIMDGEEEKKKNKRRSGTFRHYLKSKMEEEVMDELYFDLKLNRQ